MSYRTFITGAADRFYRGECPFDIQSNLLKSLHGVFELNQYDFYMQCFSKTSILDFIGNVKVDELHKKGIKDFTYLNPSIKENMKFFMLKAA